jgi:hypothetical protein
LRIKGRESENRYKRKHSRQYPLAGLHRLRVRGQEPAPRRPETGGGAALPPRRARRRRGRVYRRACGLRRRTARADGVIDIAQLHGGEDARYIAKLKAAFGAPVVKALPARADRSEYEGVADYLLFDAFLGGVPGGAGERFDWSEIGACAAPFFLAGGLAPENAAEAIAAVSPYALDVSSGVETDGYKDFEKMKRFIEAAGEAL